MKCVQFLVTQERPRHGKKNSSGSGSGEARHRTPLKDNECYYCGENDHFMRDCPVKKGVVAHVVEQSNEEIVEVMAIINEEKETAERILDLDCIVHLCSHIDWFSSYKPIEGKV